MTTPFVKFPKIPRLRRETVVTEKLDGTNAQIYVGEDGGFLVGSRNRWITPDDDNFGFATWAYERKEELMGLGHGHHFGEWWGQGIQRGYGLDEKRFSLFNTARWNEDNPNRPACCHVVPVLNSGLFDGTDAEYWVERLKGEGSRAAPGFMNPEGVVVYHTAAKMYFKMTCEKDEKPKGLAA